MEFENIDDFGRADFNITMLFNLLYSRNLSNSSFLYLSKIEGYIHSKIRFGIACI